MKKSIILFILVVVLIILASCSTSKKDDKFHAMDSKTFLDSITLPEKLSIDINLDNIKKINEAKTYKADYMEFDKQKLINAFIKNRIYEENIFAEGPQIIASAANIEEFLSVYDGGKSFGVETGMQGGFRYMTVVDDIMWGKLDTVASISFLHPNMDGQVYGYALNSDYGSFSDLDFLSYEDSLTDIKKIFNIAEIPQFYIAETYSLDLETMMSHYRLYLKREILEDDMKNLSWTKEDEAYIFFLYQLVDNIPIVNKVWQMPDGTRGSAWGNPMPATSINLVYDRNGVRQIAAENIMNIVNEAENNSLINLYEALNTLVESYSSTILEDEISIVSAELCYLSIPKDDMLELIPGWVFCSNKAREIDGKTFIEYKYDVVNAITGKLYQDRW